ncbi:MAG: DUF4260 family protein [Chloroflexi bacterium]|nr:DUF4260 domain-containing protein [Chloroflexota bacterium]MQC26746.1 DUF4260 family protein [Chloroflexota bacterium]
MKETIRLEEAALFGLGVLAYAQLNLSWWWFAALLFAPDLSMLGYLLGTKPGALLYNLIHHRGLAIAIYLLGVNSGNPGLTLAGVMLFTHSSLDRVFGYGLKYADSFQNTHLGRIGKAAG